MDNKGDTLADLKCDLDKVQGWANGLRILPYILFALGVVVAPFIAPYLQ